MWEGRVLTCTQTWNDKVGRGARAGEWRLWELGDEARVKLRNNAQRQSGSVCQIPPPHEAEEQEPMGPVAISVVSAAAGARRRRRSLSRCEAQAV